MTTHDNLDYVTDALTHPTYDNLHYCCQEIVNHFNDLEYEEWAGEYYARTGRSAAGDPPEPHDTVTCKGKKFDLIVGIARGGLFPAIVISHILNIPMESVFYSSKQGAGDNRSHANNLPELPLQRYGKILIVDDICDTGFTLAEVKGYYAGKDYNITTATFYHKEGAIIEPDFYNVKLPKDAPWVVFPYEALSNEG